MQQRRAHRRVHLICMNKIEALESGAVIEREKVVDSLYHTTLGDSDSGTRSQESCPVSFAFPLRSIDPREV